MPEISAQLVRSLVSGSVLPAGLAHQELQTYLFSRVPQPDPPENPRAWEREAARLRERFLERVVFRGVPRSWRVNRGRVEFLQSLPRDGYRIRKLRYEAVPGLWIPALLYEPDALTHDVPGVLNVNGHVGAPGKAIEYEQIRSINLARRNVVSLHPEWLACGELSGPDYRHNRLAHLDLCGVSGLAVMFLAMQHGLDVLLDHSRVDRKRVAMTGLSGGGWQTILLGGLDTRVRAIVPNAGYIGLSVRVEHRSDVGDLEQIPTDLLETGDYTHLTAMLAPRPTLLIYNEKDECCFATARAKPSVYEPMRPFFEQFGADFRFHNNKVPGTHNYDQDNREQFYRFVHDVLQPPGPRREAELTVTGELMPQAQLNVGTPPANQGFTALAAPLAARLPEDRWPGPKRESGWLARSRKALREVLRLPEDLPSPAQPLSPASVPGLPPGTQGRRLRYRVSDTWTLPAVELWPERARGSALVLCDGTRADAAEQAAAWLRRDIGVTLLDVTLNGECDVPGWPRWQNAALVGCVGSRLLGLQAEQVLAVLVRMTQTAGGRGMSLAGVGRRSAVLAVVAAALAGGHLPALDELQLHALPPSLKLLIETGVEYESAPELFCFGLLKRHDVREMLALARVGKVDLLSPDGDPARWRLELGDLFDARGWALA